MRAQAFMVPAAVSALFLSSSRGLQRLRIGVLCEGPMVPRYVRGVLDDLLRADYISLALAINIRYPVASHKRFNESLGMRLLSTPVEAYYRQGGDPLEAVPCADLLEGVPRAMISGLLENGRIAISEVDALAVRAASLDVLINFCAWPFTVMKEALARHGVWYFHFGDSRRYPDGSGFIRELVDRDPLTGIELLQQMGPTEEPMVLMRALFGTSPFPSRYVNRFAPVWGARHFVVQKLWELRESGILRALSKPIDGAPTISSSRSPGTGAALRWLAIEAMKRLFSVKRLGREPSKWRVGVRRSTQALFEEPAAQALKTFNWLNAPPGHYWADPVLCEVAGQTWLFFEHMIESDGIAQISCGRLQADGNLVEVRTVLRRPHHLSYPQIIQSDGEIFMLPEAAQSGGLDLYRARRFPDDWVLEARLLDFRCVDSAIFKSGDIWCMVTSPQLVTGHAPITWLLRANDLTGPWKYCLNGIVANSASVARGAGGVFEHKGRLIRPSQDCGRTYGEALLFNKIESIIPEDYSESVFHRVDGSGLALLAGVHSYSRVNDWECIDGRFQTRAAPWSYFT